MRGLAGEDAGAEGDPEPMNARNAGCSGFTTGTAWGAVRFEGLGGSLSVGADARGRVVADFGGMVTIARWPKPESAVARGMSAAVEARSRVRAGIRSRGARVGAAWWAVERRSAA